jgi:eukaryotic-like serine/threonine-protein kinase
MPAPCTANDFLSLVRKSGVVDAPAVAAMERRLAAAPLLTPRLTANLMVREGTLTKLQASQLLRGKWRNFIIGGKYKLLEHIGSGGMGQVYLCEHTRMGRRVAIKILPPDKATESVCLERFFREARAAAALDHPNIVRAHDLDKDESGPEPLHFLVMEYVDGSSLQHIVGRFGPLPIPRACHYIAQTADGLQHAHEAGLVHRDVKPANLLLDRSGLVKILDLGLARFFFDAGDDLTQRLGAHYLIGTADYLAPEQADNSHNADIRADIYSLGVTFFFLLTGRSPFKEGTIAQKLLYHRVQQPDPVQKVRPDVPAEIARVIDRMLAKDPRNRFQEPFDVRLALDPWTAERIGLPPEAEMPQLSRAARRAEPPTAAIARNPGSTIHNRPAPAPAPLPTDPLAGRSSRPGLWDATWAVCRSITGRVADWFHKGRP